MLRFAEEIMLLLLDDENGRFASVARPDVDSALAGGVLMDLALESRIDTDLHKLVLVDPTPTGEAQLDAVLADIAAEEHGHDARYWVERVAARADEIREGALARLVERGILQRRDDRFLWVFRSRRYPVVDGAAEREVKLRIMDLLFSDELPDPRDVVIICLGDVCGLFQGLLTQEEHDRAYPRIEQMRKLDLIGQAVMALVSDERAESDARLQFLIEQGVSARP